jgi:hypothetical protein
MEELMNDPILCEMVKKETFDREDFIVMYSRHRPLNLNDPIWKFVIREELKHYLESGAIRKLGDKYKATSIAKEKVKELSYM